MTQIDRISNDAKPLGALNAQFLEHETEQMRHIDRAAAATLAKVEPPEDDPHTNREFIHNPALQAYCRLVVLVALLRNLEADRHFHIRNSAKKDSEDESWWKSSQAWLDLTSGVAQAGLGFAGQFTNLGELAKGAQAAITHFSSTGKSLMETKIIPARFNQSIEMQKLQHQYRGEDGYRQLQEQIRRQVETLDQMRADAMRRVGRAAAGG